MPPVILGLDHSCASRHQAFSLIYQSERSCLGFEAAHVHSQVHHREIRKQHANDPICAGYSYGISELFWNLQPCFRVLYV